MSSCEGLAMPGLGEALFTHWVVLGGAAHVRSWLDATGVYERRLSEVWSSTPCDSQWAVSSAASTTSGTYSGSVLPLGRPLCCSRPIGLQCDCNSGLAELAGTVSLLGNVGLATHSNVLTNTACVGDVSASICLVAAFVSFCGNLLLSATLRVDSSLHD